jgi:SAM-dependent methyltransferase
VPDDHLSNVPMAIERADVCTLCGNTRSRPRFSFPPYAYVACQECGLTRMSLRIASADLQRYYSEAYAVVYRDSEAPLADQLANPTFAFRASRLERYAHRRNFYEIGCGDGNFLAVLRNRGWNVGGCDVSATGAKAAQVRHGLSIDVVSFDNLRLPGNLDAIGFYHVLEHQYDPRPLLREVARSLQPGGLVHLQIPNIASLDGRLGGRHWWGLTCPQHVYLYTPSHLRRLLAEEGFEVRSIATFDPFHSPAAVDFTIQSWIKDVLRGSPPATSHGPSINGAPHAGAPAAQASRPAMTLARKALRAASTVVARAQSLVGQGNVADVIAIRR